VSIVFACALSVEAYAELGRDVVVPRPDCPVCSRTMGFWGFYVRDIRIGQVVKLLVRRVRCPGCRTSHPILPDFVVHGRLDGIEVIGAGIQVMASGAGTRRAAAMTGVPHTTVRGWWRRLTSRAAMLTAGFWASCVALENLVPRVVASSSPAVLSAAITSAVTAARRRLGVRGSEWRIANRIIGGHLISTNRDPPWAAS
jgi:hypothetical protein